MTHITKSHLKKAMREHHMIGEMLGHSHMLGPRNGGLSRATHKKAEAEHHFIGSLIGMLAKGAGMAAPYISKGIGMLAKNSKNIGHAVNAASGVAQIVRETKAAKEAKEASAAQRRMMHAQAQGVEDQNAYMKKQMGAQAQKRGGRTKRH